MENTKTVVLDAAGFLNEIFQILEDKKLKLSELPALLPHLMRIPRMVRAMPHLKHEIENMTFVQREQLYTEVAKKIQIANEKSEIIVETVIAWVLHTLQAGFVIAQALKK